MYVVEFEADLTKEKARGISFLEFPKGVEQNPNSSIVHKKWNIWGKRVTKRDLSIPTTLRFT